MEENWKEAWVESVDVVCPAKVDIARFTEDMIVVADVDKLEPIIVEIFTRPA